MYFERVELVMAVKKGNGVEKSSVWVSEVFYGDVLLIQS